VFSTTVYLEGALLIAVLGCVEVHARGSAAAGAVAGVLFFFCSLLCIVKNEQLYCVV